MQTKQRRITSILIALAVLLVSSISVLAYEGGYDESSFETVITDASGSPQKNSTNTNGPYMSLLVPEIEYLSANKLTDDGVTYFDYREILTKQDASETISLLFSIQGQGANNSGFTSNPVGFKTNTYLYDSISLENAVATDGNGFVLTAGGSDTNPYQTGDPMTAPTTAGYSWIQIDIDANTLEPASDYYLVFEKTCYTNKTDRSLGQDFVIKFETAAAPIADPEATEDYNAFQAALNNGNTNSLYMTTPSPSGIKTAGVQTYEDGTQYYFNEITTPLCADKDQVFAIDVTGSQANHITDDPLPAHYYYIYSDNSFSEDSLVASLANGKMTNATKAPRAENTLVPPNSNNGFNVSVTVPAGTLENDKGYYFVVDKGMSTMSNPTKTDYVFKFTTGHTEEAMEAIAPTCTEVGHEAGVACTQCKTYSEGGAEIAALGHTEEVLAAKEATCTETGLTEGKKCSVCGETLVAQEEIPALGHDYKDGVCTRCGEEKPKMTAELTSSEGTELKARTQTTLKVENMQNGNPEDYVYKFIVYNTTTDQWYKLQDYSDATTFDWYTGPEGVKNLFVDIKSKTDETDITRISLSGVTVTDTSVKVESFTSSKGDTLEAKTKTTLTATAKDGTEPYQYKFIVHNNRTDEWYRIQDFSESNSCEWYTAGADSKTLYVDVKDADGTVDRKGLDVTVTE